LIVIDYSIILSRPLRTGTFALVIQLRA
jgi:hypothetical protein